MEQKDDKRTMKIIRVIEFLTLAICVTVFGGPHKSFASPHGSDFPASIPCHRRSSADCSRSPREPSAILPRRKLSLNGQRLLKPPPTPRPPMKSAVGWLTAEGAPVCVVAVGRESGVRWLRALHGRARAPVLLWWPAAQAREGAAPAWLEGRKAYLLATNNPARLLGFLSKDVISTTLYQHLKESLGYIYGHVQLQSTSRVVVSVVDKKRDIPRKLLRIHEQLMIKHQILDWHLIHETGHEINGHLSLRGRPFPIQPPLTSCAGIACFNAEADNISPESGNIIMATYIPKIKKFEAYPLSILGLKSSLIGPHKRLLKEMTKRMKIKWLNMFQELNRFFQESNSVMNLTLYQVPNVMPLLVQGIIEVYAAPLATNLTMEQSIAVISGSGRIVRVHVAVPRATPLPAWSLPLRVWGWRVWVALAGAMLAYALAWRAVAGESLGASVAAALRAFSSCGGSPQDRVRATRMRLQLAAALLASAVVLVSTYQGRLFTLMSRPQRGSEIASWEQLAASGLPVYSTEGSVLWRFRNPDPEAHTAQQLRWRSRAARALPSRLVSYERLPAALRRQRACIITSGADLRRAQRVLRACAERMRVRLMQEALYEAHQTLFARRNWPWTDATNQLILRIDASGLRSFWENDYWQKIAFIRRMLSSGREELFLLTDEDDGSSPKAFDISAVSAHLQLLTAGLVAASLVLCVELWTHRRIRPSTGNTAWSEAML